MPLVNKSNGFIDIYGPRLVLTKGFVNSQDVYQSKNVFVSRSFHIHVDDWSDKPVLNVQLLVGKSRMQDNPHGERIIMRPQKARELAAALTFAADEIERREKTNAHLS